MINHYFQILNHGLIGQRLARSAPIAEVLKDITIGLSDRYRSLNECDCMEKVALMGGPGVGKTTTLCKFLAHEVFMNKTSPCVS